MSRNIKQLTTLNISWNSIGERGALAIADNLRQLTTLDISGNGIGEKGLWLSPITSRS